MAEQDGRRPISEEPKLVLYLPQRLGAYHQAVPGVERSSKAVGESKVFEGVHGGL